MPSTSAFVFHNAEFSAALQDAIRKLDADSPHIRQATLYALEVALDVPTDDRDLVFFKGLSARAASALLRVVSCHSDEPYRADMTPAQLRNETMPFDDMPFVVEETGEDLNVVYSIQSMRERFRQCIIGPQSVELYEHDVPHFGVIWVYAADKEEVDEKHETRIVRTMQPIRSTPEQIFDTLETLNFGDRPQKE